MTCRPMDRGARIGTPHAEDVVVYEEGDEAFYVGIGRDSSDEVMYIHVGAWGCTGVC